MTKNAPRDCTAADMKMLLKQPAAGGESRERDSLFELAKKVYVRNSLHQENFLQIYLEIIYIKGLALV